MVVAAGNHAQPQTTSILEFSDMLSIKRGVEHAEAAALYRLWLVGPPGGKPSGRPYLLAAACVRCGCRKRAGTDRLLGWQAGGALM